MSRLIVIAEDEQAIADSIAYALRTDGFTPHHVTLAADALQAVRTLSPALVVLDVGLPDLNGFELCRQLRQFSNVPVIFLTARSDEIDRIVGLEIGADDYVTKPFSPRELVARIRVVLRRLSPAPIAPAVQAPRFELREEQARILYRGQPLDLTRYEYLLLKTLLAHPGHVLGRAGHPRPHRGRPRQVAARQAARDRSGAGPGADPDPSRPGLQPDAVSPV